MLKGRIAKYTGSTAWGQPPRLSGRAQLDKLLSDSLFRHIHCTEIAELRSAGQPRAAVPTWFLFSVGACGGLFGRRGFVGQHFANLAPKVGWGEGLLDERHAWDQHVGADELAAVSGHVKDFYFRAKRADLFAQGRAVHS